MSLGVKSKEEDRGEIREEGIGDGFIKTYYMSV